MVARRRRGPIARTHAAVCVALVCLWGGAAGEVRFVEAGRSAGLDFVHVNGMTGKWYLAEIMGAGAAVLDFDDDGLMDLWLIQGGPLDDRSGELPMDRLFRNVSRDGVLRFVDITETSGVRETGYGMGIATGDVDGDGDLDVAVLNYGPNKLYENIGGGRFRDITEASGMTASDWSVGGSFLDADGDGWQDFYVANYVDFTLEDNKACHDLAARPTYCHPGVYRAAADRLYRNEAGRGFREMAITAAAARFGAALGVIAEDFNGDGHQDLYVANDATSNLLWINQGNGRFADHALLAGVAVNGDGDAEASMGVAAEDYDNDCDVDLFVTHLAAETNTLYVNDGEGWFTDLSNRTGVAAASMPFTGFGTAWFDADNDGDLDLFSANGTVTPLDAQRAAGEPHPLRQVNQIWLDDGHGRYREVDGGPAFGLEEVSRGAAFGDLDNDGDMDIVVANNRGPVRLYRNDSPRAHWLGLDLRGAGGEVMLGARARLDNADCGERRAATDGSYASANDPRIVFGLGASAVDDVGVRVEWPDGGTERFRPLEPDRYHRLRKGGGTVE